MDDILPKLLHFPPHPQLHSAFSESHYDESIRHHIQVVGSLPEKSLLHPLAGEESALDVSTAEPQKLRQVLMIYAKVVDPARNTASYIFILIAYINAYNRGNKTISDVELFQKISKFLKSFDGRQIRYLGKEFNKVVDALVQMVVGVRQVSLCAQVLVSCTGSRILFAFYW